MKSLNVDYYGDSFRWFIGRAINNKDPLALGRIQVRVYGLHSGDVKDIPTRDLPWAQVIIPSTEGGISGIGKLGRIQTGALVIGFFLDGESAQLPVVIGSLHTIETNVPFATPDSPNYTSGEDFTRNVSVPADTDRTFNESRAYPRVSTTEPGSTELMGGSNAEKIYNFFLANGFTPNQAAGWIGNFSAESNLNPEALNPNDVGKPAFGLAQWRGTRYAELKEFAAENNLDYRSLEAQLEFTMYELNKYPYLGLSQIRAANTLQEAVTAIEKKFERPAPGTFEKRYSFARQALERYAA